MTFRELPLRDRAVIIKSAVSNGIRTLPEIESAYNEFACGGNMFTTGGPMYPFSFSRGKIPEVRQ